MARCCKMTQKNGDDSRASSTASDSGRLRLWTPLFRKRLFDVIACGGRGGRCSSRRRGRWNREDESNGGGERVIGGDDEKESGSEEGRRRAGSENKLSDFLSMKVETADDEDRRLRRKETVVMEQFKRAVAALGESDKVAEAASEVRRLAKDDASARSLLAMLGAIPPLVGKIDCGKDGDERMRRRPSLHCTLFQISESEAIPKLTQFIQSELL